MGLLDAIQNLISGASGAAQGSVADIANGLGNVPGVQEVQDLAGGVTELATSVADGAVDAATTVAEQGQAAVEDAASNVGL